MGHTPSLNAKNNGAHMIGNNMILFLYDLIPQHFS